MRLISSETNLSGRLAVQGGKGNNYYDDPCDSTDRFDFVLAVQRQRRGPGSVKTCQQAPCLLT